MCFSATASFTASAVLGAIGIATVSQIRNRRELPLATIPFVFAIQQFVEGFIWVNISQGNTNVQLLTNLFLFFALFWWPVFVPITTYLLETDKKTKDSMFILWLIGLFIGTFQYIYFVAHPTAAQIVNRCIYYNVSSPLHSFATALYLSATIGVTLLSSHKNVQLFGVLAAISATVSAYLYYDNFTSVWCFFGALLSFVLFFHFKTKKA